VVHTAATFGPDMAEQEAAFLQALIDWSASWTRARGGRLPLVYTGGCWLYGAVGDRTAVEGAPFDPLPAFAFMVAHRRRLLAESGLDVRIVHPAMVWDDGAGVIGGFFEATCQGRAPQVIGPPDTRWPMVHRQDLARLYRLVLERGAAGTDYHGVTETGVPVGDIAGAVSRRCRAPAPIHRPVGQATAELGAWAAGYALDQTMDAPHTRRTLGWRAVRPPLVESILNG
jgi:nucleoside-diphosphate-sugar epimerase